jgi:hypothetical protein
MGTTHRGFVLTFLSCLLLAGPGRAASPFPWQSWATPVPLSGVNTELNDKSPFLSFDGRTLYFSRDNGWDFARIFAATRAAPGEPFGEAREILADAAAQTSYPWVSADNLRMYYYSSSGMTRLLRMSQRDTADAPWPPGSYVSELNALGSVANPTLTEDELVIVFSGLRLRGGRGEWDLWMASRPDREAPFGHVTNLRALNTTAWDMHPSLSPDGLTLYFASNRSGHFQVFNAYRASRATPFGRLRHLAIFDTAEGSSMYPSLSADETSLYFGSQGDGGFMDIWVSYAQPGYYVDAVTGNDAGDGLSPRRALATIQKAIHLAKNGDVISVFPGVYREELDFAGKAITVQSIGDAVVLRAPDRTAVTFRMGEGPNTVLRNLIVADSYVGIFCAHTSPTITNVTLVGNVYGLEAYGRNLPRVSNCIFWGNTDSDVYGCPVTYCCVERGAEGEGNFRVDPLLVDPENGDYHLRSEHGRYWPEHDVWVLDDLTSPCIDAGDLAADFSAEREPNGGRLNVGAYGGTAYASLSTPPFSVDVNHDGTIDAADLERFTDLWEQQTQPPVPPGGGRRR